MGDQSLAQAYSELEIIIEDSKRKIEQTRGYQWAQAAETTIREIEESPEYNKQDIETFKSQLKLQQETLFLYQLIRIHLEKLQKIPKQKRKEKIIEILYFINSLQIAYQEHDEDQRDTGEPYIRHPIGASIDFVFTEYLNEKKRVFLVRHIQETIQGESLQNTIEKILESRKKERWTKKVRDSLEKSDLETALYVIVDHHKTAELQKIFNLDPKRIEKCNKDILAAEPAEIVFANNMSAVQPYLENMNLSEVATVLLHDVPEEQVKRQRPHHKGNKEKYNLSVTHATKKLFKDIRITILEQLEKIGIEDEDHESMIRRLKIYQKIVYQLARTDFYIDSLEHLGSSLKKIHQLRKTIYKKSDRIDNLLDVEGLDGPQRIKQLLKTQLFASTLKRVVEFYGKRNVDADYRRAKIARNHLFKHLKREEKALQRMYFTQEHIPNIDELENRIAKAFETYATTEGSFNIQGRKMSFNRYKDMITRLPELTVEEITRLFPGTVEGIGAILDRKYRKNQEEYDLFMSKDQGGLFERFFKYQTIRLAIAYIEQRKGTHITKQK